ncbi:MAG: oligosaccharide flippase family protein [Aliarcobacter sp.]|nr:oligosaccharide flippase family protein [Aliarcobacter sp.]
MISKLKPKSEFGRNVLTLMTGTTIAQAIPIAITPILTRLYTPEEFGVLALFVSITILLGTVISGRYDLAIMMPERDEEAIGIAALGLIIATIISILLIFPVVIYNNGITSLLKNKEIGYWLYFVPLVVWMIGLFNILSYLNTRKKLYSDIAKAQIYKAVAMSSLQLTIGFVKSGAVGLISGQIASHIASIFGLMKKVRNEYDLSKWDDKTFKFYLKRYKRFPLYSLPGTLLNVGAGNLLSLVLPTIYSLSTLGFYSIAQRALGGPSALIGSSIAQVFFQHATDEKNKTGKIINTFDATVKKLFLISLPIFSIIYFIIEDVFAFAFGEDWREAGIYAKILTPMFAVNFIVSAVSITDSIMEKQQYYMFFNFFLFVNTLLLIFVFKFATIYDFITVLSISVSILYILYGLFIRKVAKAEF